MKKILVIMLVVIQTIAFSDSVTIEELRDKAISVSSLNQELIYNESKLLLEEKNLTVNYLPSVLFSARATYQSDVFNLPIELPANLGSIPEVSKDQYNLQFDINQTIYDGGITSSLKSIKSAENTINNTAIKVSLYQINNIINELYFGILKIDASKKSILSIKEDINNRRSILLSSVDNGVLLQSDINALDIELKKIEQQLTELNSSRITFVDMLSRWAETDLTDVEFVMPQEPDLRTNLERPELELFDARKSLASKSKNLIKSDYMPKIGAFIQAGYGKPTPVNFLAQDYETYYKAGIQLQWNIWKWNKYGREIQIAEIQKKSINAEEKNFLKANDIEMSKYINNIQKYNELINSDEQMLSLQKENIEVVFSKLQNGTVNSTEYISEQNILSRMMINSEIHKIELLKSKYDLLYTKGGFNNYYGDK